MSQRLAQPLSKIGVWKSFMVNRRALDSGEK
jgi:hypothetical protein